MPERCSPKRSRAVSGAAWVVTVLRRSIMGGQARSPRRCSTDNDAVAIRALPPQFVHSQCRSLGPIHPCSCGFQARPFRFRKRGRRLGLLLPAGRARAWGTEMPINRLLAHSKLAPDEIENLNVAFKQALRSLHIVDRDDPLAELVARKIIEIDATGVHDAAEIAEIAVKQL